MAGNRWIDGLHADAAGSFVIFLRLVLCGRVGERRVSGEAVRIKFCGGRLILLIP